MTVTRNRVITLALYTFTGLIMLVNLIGCGDSDASDLQPDDSGVSDAAADSGASDAAADSGVSDAAPDSAVVDAAVPGAAYYFESLGLVDDGPPLFIIIEKAVFDANNCTPGMVSPVPPGVLPAGFTLDSQDPTNTSYRYNGPPSAGIMALESVGFTRNPALDQLC